MTSSILVISLCMLPHAAYSLPCTTKGSVNRIGITPSSSALLIRSRKPEL
jgi:hypothetical protein